MFDKMAKRIGLALATATFAFSAAAEEELVLKFVQPLPASHLTWTSGGKVFADMLAEKTDGKVTIEAYHAGQLGKDYLGILQSGIGDIVVLPPSYLADKLPLTSVAELPGVASSSCDAVGRLWKVAQEGGVLDRLEYEPFGLRILYVKMAPPYSLLTTGANVSSVESVGGLKVRTNGGSAMNRTAESADMIPVKVTSGEFYDALTRGTVDGAILSFASLETYNLDTVIKYAIDKINLGASSLLVTMTEKRWQSLPDNVKAAITEIAPAAQQSTCEAWDSTESEGKQAMIKKAAETGFQLNEPSAEEITVWEARLKEVGLRWAAKTDSAGLKGSEVLNEFLK
ncbi:TRAP transporter substrate-binding protein DctP [Sedimentitalea sp.]|uniref:TRAP transporter substrate-binding protein DctP n=1 Tax=Sedimentitalea sp. TaxID=2048915 RepID=UPI003296AE9F